MHFSGCGTCGFFAFNGCKVRGDVTAMVNSMNHRGPNSKGEWENDGVHLGHTRLSIQDLSDKGHQPMIRKSAVITFNGEIYNFGDIREILLQDGIEFDSTTDTEVLLYGYLKWGTSVVERLNGFFSFAIWDQEKQFLWVVNDRLGVKPLYYYANENFFVFASEVETLLKSKVVPVELDWDVVIPFAVFSAAVLDINYTPVKGVLSLTPGHHLTVTKDGKVVKTKYWDIPNPDPALEGLTSEEAAQTLKGLAEDAIRLRMIADVPLCSFLSGGIDSSLITAHASSFAPLTSFCVNYGARNSDNEFSEKVVEHLGDRVVYKNVDIALTEVTIEQIEKTIDLSVFSVDDRILSLYANYKAIKDHGFTVVLNGQGADEVLAGYVASPWFAAQFYNVYDPEDTFAKKLGGMHAQLDWNASNLTDLAKTAREKIQTYYQSEIDKIDQYQTSEIHKVSRWLSQHTLRCWFRQEDFNSMRHSIECRVPFSDHRIVEYCFKLPFHLHFDKENKIGKVLLRSVASHHLPPDVAKRPKQNFPSGDPNLLKKGLTKIILQHSAEMTACPLTTAIYKIENLVNEVDKWDGEDLWRVVNLWLWNKKFSQLRKEMQ